MMSKLEKRAIKCAIKEYLRKDKLTAEDTNSLIKLLGRLVLDNNISLEALTISE